MKKKEKKLLKKRKLLFSRIYNYIFLTAAYLTALSFMHNSANAHLVYYKLNDIACNNIDFIDFLLLK